MMIWLKACRDLFAPAQLMFLTGAAICCLAIVGSDVKAQNGNVKQGDGRGPRPIPIVTEKADGVAERVFFDYSRSATRALRSYAMVTVVNGNGGMCSGTMIGPNVLLTAAHCQATQPVTATFRAYVTAGVQRTETYQCDYLVHTWPETDLLLYWCDARAGVNPGDRWGYVDFDIELDRGGKVRLGDSGKRLGKGVGVYSVWQNSVAALKDGLSHHLYSAGKITSTTEKRWFNPGRSLCRQDDDKSVGIATDTWGASGASGSSQLSLDTHRILVGPTSLAPDDPDGGASRDALAIITLLSEGAIKMPSDHRGNCPDITNPTINRRKLQSLWDEGIRFDSNRTKADKYVGRVDKDRNGIFDIQQDLEASAGKSRREFYHLGFESNRRNALWTRFPSAWFEIGANTGYVRVDLRGKPDRWHQMVRHDRLNLDPAQTYRVRYAARSDGQARLVACSNINQCASHELAAGEDSAFVDVLAPGASFLSFLVRGNATVSVSDVAIVQDNAVFTFDSHDQRRMWRRTITKTHAPAYFLPNGRQAESNVVDWAGIVRQGRSTWQSPTLPLSSDRLVSDMLALPSGEVRVCFEHRLIAGPSGDLRGRVRVLPADNYELRFGPESGWTRDCTEWIRVTRAGAMVDFSVSGEGELTYAVDNVRVEHRR